MGIELRQTGRLIVTCGLHTHLSESLGFSETLLCSVTWEFEPKTRKVRKTKRLMLRFNGPIFDKFKTTYVSGCADRD